MIIVSLKRAFYINILALFCFSINVFGAQEQVTKQPPSVSEKLQKALAFRVMTTNVCHPAEIQKDASLYSKFAWANRKDRIFRQILDESPDIIGFQEVRNEPGRSSVADIWEGLGKYGYEIVSFRNNPSELSFINTIAYKTNKFF